MPLPKLRLLSINVKLFLCFWLIILLSVLATGFITEQMTNSQFELPLNEIDARQLDSLSRQQASGKISTIDELFDKAPRRYSKSVIIKDPTNHWVISNNGKKAEPFFEYLKNTKFSTMITLRVPHGRITGPLVMVFEGQEYKVFMSDQAEAQSVIEIYHLLPTWIKLFIPMLVSLGLCWVLARSLARPIYRIRNAAKRIGDGDLSARVHSESLRSDELGSLANSFNQMANKLESSVSAQQRLIADVSHELRSPLTRLQLGIALAQKSTASPDELNKQLNRCELEVERLDDMIGHVLALSKLENSLYTLAVEPLNIEEFITLIVQDAQFFAKDKSITISLSECPKGDMLADAGLLTSAISNVLTNAIKYSPDETHISVDISHTAQSLIFVISDSGPGVPEKSLSKLFEPFYRVAAARDRKTGGTGLGLAITKQSVLAHSGEIIAENKPEGGLKISITIPRSLNLSK